VAFKSSNPKQHENNKQSSAPTRRRAPRAEVRRTTRDGEATCTRNESRESGTLSTQSATRSAAVAASLSRQAAGDAVLVVEPAPGEAEEEGEKVGAHEEAVEEEEAEELGAVTIGGAEMALDEEEDEEGREQDEGAD
jgi:hypothetical protein